MSEGSGISALSAERARRAEALLDPSERPASVDFAGGPDGPVARLSEPGSYPRKPVVAVGSAVILLSVLSALTQHPRFGDEVFWVPFWVTLWIVMPIVAVEVLQQLRNGQTLRAVGFRPHELVFTRHHGAAERVNLHGLVGLEVARAGFGRPSLDLQDRAGVITRYPLADPDEARWVGQVVRAWAAARSTAPDPEQLARLARLTGPSRATEAASG